MNIFNGIRSLEELKEDARRNHEKYLEKRGITEEQFQEELEENARRSHEKYLKERGITEEQFQEELKREQKERKKKEKWNNIKEYIEGGILSILFLTLCFGCFFIDKETFSSIGKVITPILCTIFIIIVIGISIAVFYGIFKNLRENEPKGIKGFFKTIGRTIIIFTFLVGVLLIIGKCCTDNAPDGDYEPTLHMRPERF